MNFIGGAIITENAGRGSCARVGRASQIFVDTSRGRKIPSGLFPDRLARPPVHSPFRAAVFTRSNVALLTQPLDAIIEHGAAGAGPQLVGVPEWKTDMMLASISSSPA